LTERRRVGWPGPGRDEFFTLPYTEPARALLYNVAQGGDMNQGRRDSFVVRVSLDRSGQLTGVVERVATGAKQTFTGVDAIGTVIAGMLAPTLRPVPRADGGLTDGVPGDRGLADAGLADGARPPPPAPPRCPV
jgi:hypothetical protein